MGGPAYETSKPYLWKAAMLTLETASEELIIITTIILIRKGRPWRRRQGLNPGLHQLDQPPQGPFSP